MEPNKPSPDRDNRQPERKPAEVPIDWITVALMTMSFLLTVSFAVAYCGVDNPLCWVVMSDRK